MSAIWLVARRELGAYFSGLVGWGIVAGLLFIDGLLFQAFAMGSGEHLSAEVLQTFFYFSFGVVAIAGVLLAMRLVSAELREGTIVLLSTAPIGEWSVVLGKFLAGWLFLLLATGATFYLPLMIQVHGSVQWGHVAAGYVGLGLVAAVVIAAGLFTSSLTSNQLLAGVANGVLIAALVVMWALAKVADPPADGLFSYMSLYDKHFLPFSKGTIHLRSVVYYLSLTSGFLLLTRMALGTRRWR